MTGADVLILVVLLGSILIGLVRGFVREAVSLCFWILAIWGAWKFGPLVEPHLGGLMADPRIAPWVGRLVILVLVLLIGWVIGMLLGYFTRSMGLGPLDRAIGLFFGIVRGMVLVGLMVIGGDSCISTKSRGGAARSWCLTARRSVIGCGQWSASMASRGPSSSGSPESSPRPRSQG